MTAIEYQLWGAIALCAALVAAIVACWAYEAVTSRRTPCRACGCLPAANAGEFPELCWECGEAVAGWRLQKMIEPLAAKNTGCRPDCPRLPGGCLGRIGGKCAARKEKK